MKVRIEWLHLDPAERTVDIPDGAQIIDIDWHYNDFTSERRPLGVWVATPISEEGP